MQSELYSVYYAHIGIMGLAEAMRIEDEEEEAGVKPELALWTNFENCFSKNIESISC